MVYGIQLWAYKEMNYSILNKNWNDAHNMQLTKHDTNDNVDARNSDDRVVHMNWACTHLCSPVVIVSHFTFHGSSSERLS